MPKAYTITSRVQKNPFFFKKAQPIGLFLKHPFFLSKKRAF